jgi:hypothetical protein
MSQNTLNGITPDYKFIITVVNLAQQSSSRKSEINRCESNMTDCT